MSDLLDQLKTKNLSDWSEQELEWLSSQEESTLLEITSAHGITVPEASDKSLFEIIKETRTHQREKVKANQDAEFIDSKPHEVVSIEVEAESINSKSIEPEVTLENSKKNDIKTDEGQPTHPDEFRWTIEAAPLLRSKPVSTNPAEKKTILHVDCGKWLRFSSVMKTLDFLFWAMVTGSLTQISADQIVSSAVLIVLDISVAIFRHFITFSMDGEDVKLRYLANSTKPKQKTDESKQEGSHPWLESISKISKFETAVLWIFIVLAILLAIAHFVVNMLLKSYVLIVLSAGILLLMLTQASFWILYGRRTLEWIGTPPELLNGVDTLELATLLVSDDCSQELVKELQQLNVQVEFVDYQFSSGVVQTQKPEPSTESESDHVQNLFKEDLWSEVIAPTIVTRTTNDSIYPLVENLKSEKGTLTCEQGKFAAFPVPVFGQATIEFTKINSIESAQIKIVFSAQSFSAIFGQHTLTPQINAPELVVITRDRLQCDNQFFDVPKFSSISFLCKRDAISIKFIEGTEMVYEYQYKLPKKMNSQIRIEWKESGSAEYAIIKSKDGHDFGITNKSVCKFDVSLWNQVRNAQSVIDFLLASFLTGCFAQVSTEVPIISVQFTVFNLLILLLFRAIQNQASVEDVQVRKKVYSSIFTGLELRNDFSPILIGLLPAAITAYYFLWIFLSIQPQWYWDIGSESGLSPTTKEILGPVVFSTINYVLILCYVFLELLGEASCGTDYFVIENFIGHLGKNVLGSISLSGNTKISLGSAHSLARILAESDTRDDAIKEVALTHDIKISFEQDVRSVLDTIGLYALCIVTFLVMGVLMLLGCGMVVIGFFFKTAWERVLYEKTADFIRKTTIFWWTIATIPFYLSLAAFPILFLEVALVALTVCFMISTCVGSCASVCVGWSKNKNAFSFPRTFWVMRGFAVFLLAAGAISINVGYVFSPTVAWFTPVGPDGLIELSPLIQMPVSGVYREKAQTFDIFATKYEIAPLYRDSDCLEPITNIFWVTSPAPVRAKDVANCTMVDPKWYFHKITIPGDASESLSDAIKAQFSTSGTLQYLSHNDIDYLLPWIIGSACIVLGAFLDLISILGACCCIRNRTNTELLQSITEKKTILFSGREK